MPKIGSIDLGWDVILQVPRSDKQALQTQEALKFDTGIRQGSEGYLYLWGLQKDH